MRTTENAQKYWPVLESQTSLSSLRNLVKDGVNDNSVVLGLRSICWKAFLLFEDLEFSSWPVKLRDSRDAYVSLRSHYLRYLEHPDEVDLFLDPLSADTDSPWNAIRKDEDLRQEILQDVDRCMPDNQYFRQPDTQNTLVDVLFVWSKLNDDIGYRQGMHEILALVLWVVERDAIQLGRPRKETKFTKIMQSCLDPGFIAHDAFALFSLIMQNAKSAYELGKADLRNASKKPTSDSLPEPPMVVRSKRILSEYLAQADPSLAAHLQEIDIVPQIFLMRWVRLLFGREFSFDQVLTMWDMLFAQDAALGCVDYVCIVMILRIRWELIDADSNTTLGLLLHYPALPENLAASSLIEDAIYLRDNPNPEVGSELVRKYTGRGLTLGANPMRHLSSRPSTPQNSALSQRMRSPLSSIRALQQPGGLESLLQDAARGVYTKGEQWGVNQAVRDAVVEVRKNVHTIQQQGALNTIRGNTPLGVEALSTEQSTPKLSYDKVVSKLETLQTRNKSLAAMLEIAIGELWGQQKSTTEEKDAGSEAVKALTLAIAKVQFVQVYLDDPEIPLPVEEADNEPSSTPVNKEAVRLPTALAIPEPKSDSGELLPDTPKGASSSTSASGEPPLNQAPPDEVCTVTQPPSNHNTPRQPRRPPLSQSSFSWMLGQDHPPDPMNAVKTTGATALSDLPSAHSVRTAFVSATHFTPSAPNRTSRDMSFLFGEADPEEAGTGTPRRSSVSARLGKGKDEKTKARKDDKDKSRLAVQGEDEEEGEVFKLGPLKR